MTGRHAAAMFGSAVLVFGLMTVGVVIALRINPLSQTIVTGVVIIDDADPRKQMPIPNAYVTGRIGNSIGSASSDATGFFRLTIPPALHLERGINLSFQSPGYQALAVSAATTDQIFIARLKPRVRSKEEAIHAGPLHTIANVRIRYTVPTESFLDVPTEVQTFEVINTANVPCRSSPPCSPNGQWKAATGGVTLDAGEHNHFNNIRTSCIAGPCPFTRIENEEPQQGGQIVKISALNWADTATFLVEADVVHSQVSDMVRQSFPVIFGQGLSFTLPPRAAGPSIEAELDGQDMFFPLGPALLLSWGTCTLTTNPDHSALYSCELKPDYRFQ
jgi:hypothetical protein